jgi:hypothetical protein
MIFFFFLEKKKVNNYVNNCISCNNNVICFAWFYTPIDPFPWRKPMQPNHISRSIILRVKLYVKYDANSCNQTTSAISVVGKQVDTRSSMGQMINIPNFMGTYVILKMSIIFDFWDFKSKTNTTIHLYIYIYINLGLEMQALGPCRVKA